MPRKVTFAQTSPPPQVGDSRLPRDESRPRVAQLAPLGGCCQPQVSSRARKSKSVIAKLVASMSVLLLLVLLSALFAATPTAAASTRQLQQASALASNKRTKHLLAALLIASSELELASHAASAAQQSSHFPTRPRLSRELHQSQTQAKTQTQAQQQAIGPTSTTTSTAASTATRADAGFALAKVETHAAVSKPSFDLYLASETGDELQSHALNTSNATTGVAPNSTSHALLSSQMQQHPQQVSQAATVQLTNGALRHTLRTTVLLSIAYTVVYIVGIVGNSFVVAIVCKSPRNRTVTNYFIANLAFADMLVLFCLPGTLMNNIFIRKYKACE